MFNQNLKDITHEHKISDYRSLIKEYSVYCNLDFYNRTNATPDFNSDSEESDDDESEELEPVKKKAKTKKSNTSSPKPKKTKKNNKTNTTNK